MGSCCAEAVDAKPSAAADTASAVVPIRCFTDSPPGSTCLIENRFVCCTRAQAYEYCHRCQTGQFAPDFRRIAEGVAGSERLGYCAPQTESCWAIPQKDVRSMKINAFLLAIGAASLTNWVTTASAEPAPDALPDILSLETIRAENYLPDFSFAGYRNGAAPLPAARGTVLRVAEFGADPDDGGRRHESRSGRSCRGRQCGRAGRRALRTWPLPDLRSAEDRALRLCPAGRWLGHRRHDAAFSAAG